MRTVLVTGLGGAGRTTVAAATAHAAAKRGDRVLFLSTGPGEVLGAPVTGTPDVPQEITDGLWAGRVDTGADFRAEFLSLQERSAAALDLLGAARLEEAELTELPGSEQFALLRALNVAASGEWDTAVVDLPPLRETIALLALPEQLRRYLRRLLPQERQAARALRPVLAQLAGVPMPAQWLYATAARWDAELALVQSVIESGDTALRVVAEPGPAAAAALRTARSGLALHGLRVEALLANRVLPRHSADTWLASSRPSRRSACTSGQRGGCPAPRSSKFPTPAATLAASPTSPCWATSPCRTAADPRTVPTRARIAAAPGSASRTAVPATASSSGRWSCRALSRETSAWSAGGMNCCSPSDRSAGSCRCRPYCAAAPWRARPSWTVC